MKCFRGNLKPVKNLLRRHDNGPNAISGMHRCPTTRHTASNPHWPTIERNGLITRPLWHTGRRAVHDATHSGLSELGDVTAPFMLNRGEGGARRGTEMHERREISKTTWHRDVRRTLHRLVPTPEPYSLHPIPSTPQPPHHSGRLIPTPEP